MTSSTHDTLVRLSDGTPVWFAMSVRILSLLILAQFLTAGLALFGSGTWELHGLIGASMLLPVAGLSIGALTVTRLRGFAWWAAIVGLLYLLQIGLGILGGTALRFHPLNAALLLLASAVLLAKVERRLSHQNRSKS